MRVGELSSQFYIEDNPSYFRNTYPTFTDLLTFTSFASCTLAYIAYKNGTKVVNLSDAMEKIKLTCR
mgnify:CR=1 FL=1